MTNPSPLLRFPYTLLRLSAGAALGALTFSTAFLAGCDEGPLGGSGGGLVNTGGSSAGGAPSNVGGGAPAGGTGTASGGGEGDPMNSACGSTDAPFKLFADEKNNIKIASTVGLPPTPMKKGDAEITFDWSGLTTDMFGNPMTQADVTHAVMVVWDAQLTNIEDIAHGISTDAPNLDEKAIIPIFLPTGGTKTSAKLTEFMDAGQNPLSAEQLAPYLDGSTVLTLMLQNNPDVTGTTPPKFGYSVKMIQGLSLDDTGPTTVSLTNTSTVITATPDLVSVTDTQVPAASNNISIDWTSTIATRGYGTNLEFVNNRIADVVVARYPAETDLSTEFTRLEGIPLDLWRAPVVAGSSLLLNDSGFVNEKNPGVPFTGVPAGSSDQYLLMLLCAKDDCRNPTPWYITPLKACP